MSALSDHAETTRKSSLSPSSAVLRSSSSSHMHSATYSHDTHSTAISSDLNLANPSYFDNDILTPAESTTALRALGFLDDSDTGFDGLQPTFQPASTLMPQRSPLAEDPAQYSHQPPSSVSSSYYPTLADQTFEDNQLLDSSLHNGSYVQDSATLDPHNLSLDTAFAMDAIPHSTITPPHLLQPDYNAVHSPNLGTSPYTSYSPSRHTSESLDPSSAAFPHTYNAAGWAAGAAFRDHRRNGSDAFSDISSHSTRASPYLGNQDVFDQSYSHNSPLISSAQNDSALFAHSVGLQQFSLTDLDTPLINPYSPNASPRLSPRPGMQQHPLPLFTQANNFGLSPNFDQSSRPPSTDANSMLMSATSNRQAPGFEANTPATNMGSNHDTLLPPEISIDFVPSQSNPLEQNQDRSQNALVLPETAGRRRTQSDPYTLGLRSVSNPNISSSDAFRQQASSNSLSPSNASKSTGKAKLAARHARGRSASATSYTHRTHMLDLADPERVAALPPEAKKPKHPATFQCELCPKRFTRAYNLRSHLRTHTDERPFECNVCGKAFARQHDRKRHQGLHSGEKRFVCQGTLRDQQPWGCGRRFARADALGRHFRSEAGRVCIQSLLLEEKLDRQRAQLEAQSQHNGLGTDIAMPSADLSDGGVDSNTLPAALLQLYPEFAKLDWSSLSSSASRRQGSDQIGAGSGLDVSSGGEGDGISENEMSIHDLQTPLDTNMQSEISMQQGQQVLSMQTQPDLQVHQQQQSQHFLIPAWMNNDL